MEDSPRRVSPATVFFAILALGLAVALYLERRDGAGSGAPAARPETTPPAKKRPPARRAPKPSPTVAPEAGRSRPGMTARIAIVIDDLGNDREALERIARWPYAVAGAVLPGLPDSAGTARRLAESGKEVLLHLPMEPDGYPRVRPGPGVVLRTDSDEKIAQTVVEGLSSVPGAVGVNNHMGSAATADPRVMRAVVRVLSERGLFLLDSRTTEASVAHRVAEEAAVPAISRRVFLDSVAGEPAVARAFEELVRMARRDGASVAIGHPYPATLAVLERELPRLASENVSLVTVSGLARTAAKSRAVEVVRK